MLQLPFPAGQSAEQLTASPTVKGRLARLKKKAAHRRFEGTLWRSASLGLIANLSLFPKRFTPSALVIGNAYKFRFWRPAEIGECLDLCLAILIWPLAMPFCALLFAAKNGSVVRQRAGVYGLTASRSAAPR